MTPVWGGLLTLVGVLAGVGATWIDRKRRSQGRVATSEAADVWKGMADLFAASESIRHDLTSSVEARDKRIAVLEAAYAVLEQDNGDLRDEKHACQDELAALKREHHE